MKRSIAAMLLFVSMSITVGRAQISECVFAPCVIYLPVIVSPEPTILPNHSAWLSSGGSLHVVGEIQNDTSQNLTFVHVYADFFDSGGQIIGTDSDDIELHILAPGVKTCFHTSISSPNNWKSYSFERPTYDTTSQSAPKLTVLSSSASVNRYGEYEIVGLVRNDDSTQIQYAEAVATLYNATGLVVDCDYDFVNNTGLNPGQSSAFDITFYSRTTFADVASYRLQVSGLQASRGAKGNK